MLLDANFFSPFTSFCILLHPFTFIAVICYPIAPSDCSCASFPAAVVAKGVAYLEVRRSKFGPLGPPISTGPVDSRYFCETMSSPISPITPIPYTSPSQVQPEVVLTKSHPTDHRGCARDTQRGPRFGTTWRLLGPHDVFHWRTVGV